MEHVDVCTIHCLNANIINTWYEYVILSLIARTAARVLRVFISHHQGCISLPEGGKFIPPSTFLVKDKYLVGQRLP